MISKLELHHIGPAPNLVAEFGERLNLITGDNGLGKSFLLDACWYALTRTWAGGDERAFYPSADSPKSSVPAVDYSIVGKTGKRAKNHAEFQFKSQTWKPRQARPAMPGLVIYARIDGGFSVWDPARNYWHDDAAETRRPDAYHFTKDHVWNGLEQGEGSGKNYLCNGLIRDVDSWHTKSGESINLLQKVLKALSPSDSEKLSIGDSVRVRLDDVRDTPTLKMPYGAVPVTQAAAGMRRVLGLAYLLVWAWEEHQKAAQLQKEAPTNRIVLLFDEIEAHLHPKWQQVFLPALLKLIDGLLLENKAKSVQFIVTSHAPLVMSSVESSWDESKDRLYDFHLMESQGGKPSVNFSQLHFAKHGSVENWLESQSFHLKSAYAPYAKKAMELADAFMRENPEPTIASLSEIETIHAALLKALGGDDEYMPYWLPYYDQRSKKKGAGK
jgi:AAA domain, putative AbiEii toxin, Type IV TA system/AAA domain